MKFSQQQLHDLEDPSASLLRFKELLDPCDDLLLEKRARTSAAITRRFFGRTMQLFAPLYLSNECINSCAYCGFSRDNPILRVTLDMEQVAAEASYLASQGFRSVLLVAGEHPKFISNGYLIDSVKRLKPLFHSIMLEVAPMEETAYEQFVQAGVEGIIVYQETYNPDVYQEVHTAGPKKNFHWRLDSLQRAYQAGCRRLGAGVLFGLADWRTEALALGAHLFFLQRYCWQAQLSVSLPRLRPAAGGFLPRFSLSDRDFAQLLFALRITFPRIQLVLSTRENATFRDAIAPLGVTMMSAGSHTEPGGYTGQGAENLHHTLGGKKIEVSCYERCATKQFEISDERPPWLVARNLKSLGFEVIWKDWDHEILGTSVAENKK